MVIFHNNPLVGDDTREAQRFWAEKCTLGKVLLRLLVVISRIHGEVPSQPPTQAFQRTVSCEMTFMVRGEVGLIFGPGQH